MTRFEWFLGASVLGYVLAWYCLVGFPSTKEADIRRNAALGLSYCLKSADATRCSQELYAYCAAHGLERSCAEGSH